MVSRNEGGRQLLMIMLAVIVGCTVGTCMYTFPIHGGGISGLLKEAMWPVLGRIGSVALGYFAIPCCAGIIFYHLITQKSQIIPMKETLCRRCGYILRGLTEPRCPECGEPI